MAQSQPFRYALPGDFNTDGTVDAADYVYWRKNFSDDPAMYDVWRANFGASLGPGSGSAGYGHRDSGPGASAEPDPAPGDTGFLVPAAAVPEPPTLALLVFAVVGPLVITRRPMAAKNRC